MSKKNVEKKESEPQPNIIAKCFGCGTVNTISQKEHPYVYEIYKKQGALICQSCGLKFSNKGLT